MIFTPTKHTHSVKVFMKHAIHYSMLKYLHTGAHG